MNCVNCHGEVPFYATFHRHFRGHEGARHFCSMECLRAWRAANEAPSPPPKAKHVARPPAWGGSY